ncbi:hypothetical protein BH11CYA1_BH11CYA1_31140 [soil metagenome]
MKRLKRAVGLSVIATLVAVMPVLALTEAETVEPLITEGMAISDSSTTSEDEPMVQSKVNSGKQVRQLYLEDAPLVEKYLLDGRLKDGDRALTAHLKLHVKDDQARFGLGVLQFLRALEELGQALTLYGLRTHNGHGLILPFLQLPATSNENCKKIDYLQARQIVDNLQKQLLEAETTLALVTDGDVKLPLHFAMIKLDFNGTSKHLSLSKEDDDSRSLWKLYAKLTNNKDIPITKAEEFYIKFDRGDVHWLRGYCHVLSTICDIYLAHDSKELFDRTAHVFFNKVDSPYQVLSKDQRNSDLGEDKLVFLDLIALLHLIRCDVVEPNRMASALNHMQAVIDQSRESWKWIMAETDDDHEWLPNPRQTGVIPNARVTESMVVAWSEIMNESEKILKGELLIPFWRDSANELLGDIDSSSESEHPRKVVGRGINLRKVFLEPRQFDLVLWAQGSAALPYLEKGKLTKGQTWKDLRGQFGNHFPGFALWFN